MTAFERHPREALDLVVCALAMQRGGAARPALLAIVDQAQTSLRHEPDHQVRRTLSWVCRAVLNPESNGSDEAMVVDAAVRVAAKALAPAADGES
ncbi:MAG TPA: hypothetical protein VGH76_16845 [Actinomycetospora sp.]|uniref:hypothetical protein n=1 Tax=Actinomycetospora sp. TaxID=1872135 RepID=UPI002F42EDA3